MEKPTLRKPEVEKEETKPQETAPVVDPVQQEREAWKAEREAFQKEKESWSKQLEDTQRKLSETAAEKATLEARITQKKEDTPDPEVGEAVKKALETAQLDPEEGAKILTALIDKTTTRAQKKAVEQAIETVHKQSEFQRQFNAHVEKVRSENKDLADFESDIARLAAEKMQVERKPYDKAIDEAVADVRKRVDVFKKKLQGDAPAPKGSQGESGGSAPVIEKAVMPAPGDTGESAEDYISLRKQKLASH